MHYMYVFLFGAVIGMMTITGMIGSYARMLVKTSRFNQLRTEKDQLKKNYSKLEEVSKEKDIQVASLGSIAGEVSALYGLKTDSKMTPTVEDVQPEQFTATLDQLYALRASALSGVATAGIGMSPNRAASLADWIRASAAPTLWPVEGRVTSSFGERIDPFNGEGAFHSGVDISCQYGHPIIAPADGVVIFADFMSGYGRLVTIDHGHGISTRYGHMSAFAVSPGQNIHRGDIVGYVGASGRVTSPHLHYEVRINNTPVNPYKYLRTTIAHAAKFDTVGGN
jgi:murein DD-endopeptidase MepM/ murein hydrolase activator NlpD